MVFKLSDSFLDSYKHRTPEWGPLGEFVYLRTYSRRIEAENRNELWWETVRRVVEGTYNIQKEHCELFKLVWNTSKAKRSAEKMYDKIFNFKFLPPGRGLWMMGSDFVKERGSAALNNPLHGDTPILTEEYGWVPIKEVAGKTVHVLTSTKLYGRDHSSTNATAKWVEANISSFEIHPTKKITYSSKFGDSYSVIASENHRWFRTPSTKKNWERVTTNDLRVGDYLPRVRPPKNYKISLQGIQHGFFFGDGTRSNGELHQFAEDKISVMRSLFTHVSEVAPLESGLAHYVVRQCPSAWGEVPSGTYRADKRYLYGFLAGYFAADGFLREGCNTRGYISSARLQELEEVKYLFTELNIRTSDIKLSSSSSNFKEERELYEFSFALKDVDKDFFIRPSHVAFFESNFEEWRYDWLRIDAIEASGQHEVYCATVPYYEQFVIDGYCLTSNCGFISTIDIDVRGSFAFTWTMDALMLGVGIGFDTKGANKITIKEPKADGIHIIPDTREGWVESVGIVLDSYLYGKPLPIFDYTLIRPYGSLIRGFGGVASGPEPLEALHHNLNTLLSKRIGSKLSSTDIVDIINMISKCVIAGNVRRSACIAIGDSGDTAYTTMKDYNLYPDEVSSHRWASNNSVFAEVGKTDYTTIVDSIALNGEPGIVWLENVQKYSRTKDAPDWLDKEAVGVNPCSEQSLENAELCCLVETFPSRHESYAEYKETLKYAYLYGKTVTLLGTHWPETNAILLKNRRIGVSQSGIQDAFVKHGRRVMLKWCDDSYSYLRELDTTYSNWLCIPKSKKITSVKPSGTVSLLPGVSAGIHRPHAEYYIRRVRVAKSNPIVLAMQVAGYPIEEDGIDPATAIIDFPVHEKLFSEKKSDVSIWQQVKDVVDYQRWWADNNVSVTITFKPEEKKEIVKVLELYEDSLKTISFLPIQDHGYAQAPYEEITKEQYEEYVQYITKPDFSCITSAPIGSKFCDGESCSLG